MTLNVCVNIFVKNPSKTRYDQFDIIEKRGINKQLASKLQFPPLQKTLIGIIGLAEDKSRLKEIKERRKIHTKSLSGWKKIYFDVIVFFNLKLINGRLKEFPVRKNILVSNDRGMQW